MARRSYCLSSIWRNKQSEGGWRRRGGFSGRQSERSIDKSSSLYAYAWMLQSMENFKRYIFGVTEMMFLKRFLVRLGCWLQVLDAWVSVQTKGSTAVAAFKNNCVRCSARMSLWQSVCSFTTKCSTVFHNIVVMSAFYRKRVLIHLPPPITTSP